MKTFYMFATALLAIMPTLALANGVHEEGYGSMMQGWGGMMAGGLWGVFAFLTWIVWLTVGVLAMIWLWNNIAKK